MRMVGIMKHLHERHVFFFFFCRIFPMCFSFCLILPLHELPSASGLHYIELAHFTSRCYWSVLVYIRTEQG